MLSVGRLGFLILSLRKNLEETYLIIAILCVVIQRQQILWIH
jgi:hypothetical protein